MKLSVQETIGTIRKKIGSVKAVYFIGCGGSMAALYSAHYLLRSEALEIGTALFTSNEFVHAAPAGLDGHCICIFCSLKGTAETVEAVKLANARGAATIAMTGSDETAMAKTAQYYFTYKARQFGNQAGSLKLAFEILHQFENYRYYDEAMSAFSGIDAVIEKGLSVTATVAEKFAKDFKDEPIFYVLASGPMYASAYTMGCCHLMEMQWKHAVVLHSGEYFHGPFETTDERLPMILLKSVGRTRELDERAERFISAHCKNLIVVDARDFGLDDLGPHVAEFFNSVVMITVERAMVVKLSEADGHSMDERRYMWKLQY